jgi:hypothetical protein
VTALFAHRQFVALLGQGGGLPTARIVLVNPSGVVVDPNANNNNKEERRLSLHLFPYDFW